MDAYDVVFNFGSALSASFWQAIIAFLVDAVVMVVVSLATQPKPQEELRGLVWGLTKEAGRRSTRTRATGSGGARRCCSAGWQSPYSSS